MRRPPGRGLPPSVALRSDVVATDAVTSAELLHRADAARLGGDGDEAIALYGHAIDLGESEGDLEVQTAAVLGLARCQEFNLAPGLLPVRLHAVWSQAHEPGQRARLLALFDTVERLSPG